MYLLHVFVPFMYLLYLWTIARTFTSTFPSWPFFRLLTLTVSVGCPLSIVEIIITDLVSNHFTPDMPSLYLEAISPFFRFFLISCYFRKPTSVFSDSSAGITFSFFHQPVNELGRSVHIAKNIVQYEFFRDSASSITITTLSYSPNSIAAVFFPT